jgi:hypothetical protein
VTAVDLPGPIRRLYRSTAVIGLLGFVSFFLKQGIRPALAFLLGAIASFGNLWLYDWLSRSIAPGATAGRKPWQAGAFIGRYLVLFTVGYAIVKALDVNPLAVVLGLLTSTGAVLVSLLFELAQSFLGK